MAKFRVSGPDGQTYEINAPDGASEEEVLAYAKSQFSKKPQTSTAAREFGVGTRGSLEGLAALPMMVGDAANTAVNYGIRGINKVAGTDIDYLPMASESFSGVLDQAGLPRPQNDAERFISSVNSAGASVLTPAGVARAAPKVGNFLAPLGERVGTQAIAGAGAGAGSEVARQQGYGPVGQTVAGLLGGVGGTTVPYLAGKTVTVPLKVGANVARSFTKSGQQKAVGNTLNQMASDRAKTLAGLDSADEIVPGSMPTAGQASKDYGMLSLERAMKSRNPEAFAIRYSQQNSARQRLLDSISKSEAERVAAVEARDAAATPLRDAAFQNKTPANTKPVLDLVEKIAKGPQGKRAPVRQAMNTVRNALKDTDDPEALYAIRQDIGDMLAGKYSGDKANLRLASKQLIEIRDALDDVIDSSAPGFKDYLAKYRELSKPINQMEKAAEAQSKATFAAPDITGDEILTQARWKKAVAEIKADKLNPFTKDQMRKIEAVADDLDRAALINNSMIRPMGSDTAQNLNVANMVGMVMNSGGGLLANLKTAAVLRPLKWITQTSQDQMDKLMVEALLDPKTAAMLMRKATPKNLEAFSKRLKDLGTAATIGSALGEQAQSQQQNRYSQ